MQMNYCLNSFCSFYKKIRDTKEGKFTQEETPSILITRRWNWECDIDGYPIRVTGPHIEVEIFYSNLFNFIQSFDSPKYLCLSTSWNKLFCRRLKGKVCVTEHLTGGKLAVDWRNELQIVSVSFPSLWDEWMAGSHLHASHDISIEYLNRSSALSADCKDMPLFTLHLQPAIWRIFWGRNMQM